MFMDERIKEAIKTAKETLKNIDDDPYNTSNVRKYFFS